MNYIEKSKEMLTGWIKYSLNDLYTCPDRPDLMCYGAGYNGWGMQTHQKAFAAFAIAATDENFDTVSTGLSKSQLLDYSLKMLRFMLETHIEGSYCCTEGDKWGHTWISILGTERAIHAIEALTDHLTAKDKDLLMRVFISEADWILDYYDIQANPQNESLKNRPESNIWNGAFLHRVAMMYPDCPRADEYKEKGTKYLINGISVPSDAVSQEIFDGKPVADWFVGNNFFSSYSLDHHGYLNVGYMVICLSNIAMLHFSYIKKGINPPKALYHHADELWKLIKTCIFDDGRLVRIGGDSRVRYCYCQDYALPMFVFVRDFLGDCDCENFEQNLVELLYQEYNYNGDGSFLSKRCSSFKTLSPIYYTRLESDKAVVLSMLLNWNSLAKQGSNKIERLTSWSEAYHGACIENGKNRFASWTWHGAEGAQGLCLPAGQSNFAEWSDNLAGEIKGMTHADYKTACTAHTEKQFDGGFITIGIQNRLSEQFVAEQQKDEVTAIQKNLYAALPDDATVVVMQYAYTKHRTYLKTVKGTKLNVPNDVYNKDSRTYYFDDKKEICIGLSGEEKVFTVQDNWINVDNTLGIIKGYGKDNLCIYTPGNRQIGIKSVLYNRDTYSFCSDIICGKCQLKPDWSDKNQVILDEGAIVISKIGASETKRLAKTDLKITVDCDDMVRSITVLGADNKKYIVLANFGDEDQFAAIHTSEKRTLINLINRTPCENVIRIAKGCAEILVAE